MGKIKNFLNRWFDVEFGSNCFALVILLVLSIGIQSFMFWFGGHTFGLFADVLLFIVLIVWGKSLVHNDNTFAYKGTNKKGWICALCLFLAIIAVYFSVVEIYLQSLLVLSLIVFVFCGIWLEKMKIDTARLFFVLGLALFYCIGAYFAMLINSIEPPIERIGFYLILVVTLLVWFKPIPEKSV